MTEIRLSGQGLEDPVELGPGGLVAEVHGGNQAVFGLPARAARGRGIEREGLYERRGAFDSVHLLNLLAQFPGPLEPEEHLALDDDVAGRPPDPVLHLTSETFHHGDDDNQYRDTQGHGDETGADIFVGDPPAVHEELYRDSIRRVFLLNPKPRFLGYPPRPGAS